MTGASHQHQASGNLTTEASDAPGRARRGVALLTALLATVFISVMTVGVFSYAFANYREGRGLLSQERSLAAAEYGQFDVIRTWDSTYTQLATGGTKLHVVTVPGGGGDSVRVTKLNATTYWISSTGSTGSSLGLGSRRRTGVILRANVATFSPIAALTTGLTNKLTQSGSAYVSGQDINPTGWTCPPVGAPTAGIAAPDTTNLNWTNSSSLPNVGPPRVLETPLAADSMTYRKFGGFTYDQLKAKANITFPGSSNGSSIQPTLLSGVCNKNTNKNWGEPWRAPTSGTVPLCQTYYPIIWAQGSFQFSGGRGQGIILVDGNFTASGGTEFAGLIIVKGAITTSGGGIKLRGAILSQGTTGNQNTMSGSTVIQLSRCALAAVFSSLGAGSGVAPLKQRSWGDLY